MKEDKPAPTWENLLQLFQQHIEDTVERIVEERMQGQQKPEKPIEKEFLTLQEVSDKVNLPIHTLKKRAKDKKLKVHRPLPTVILVHIDEYNRFVKYLKAS